MFHNNGENYYVPSVHHSHKFADVPCCLKESRRYPGILALNIAFLSFFILFFLFLKEAANTSVSKAKYLWQVLCNIQKYKS